MTHPIPASYMALPDILRQRKNMTLDEFADLFCKHNGITLDELKLKRRYRRTVELRQMCCYLMRLHFKACKPQIGRVFGQDHSTVFFSIQTAQNRWDTEPNYRELLIKSDPFQTIKKH